MSDGTKPTIFECIKAIIEELPAIGKDDFNEQQGFKFRSVEAVLNALNPLLGKHGVFYVPNVIERVADKRPTRSGGTMYEVNLHVQYTFYGPSGDGFTCSSWGEGTDMGDKATNKAMTSAMKYMLVQVFAISTADQVDSDRTTPEETGTIDPQDWGKPVDNVTPVGANPEETPACPKCGKPMVAVPQQEGSNRPLWKCSTAGWDKVLKVATGCEGVRWPPRNDVGQDDGYGEGGYG